MTAVLIAWREGAVYPLVGVGMLAVVAAASVFAPAVADRVERLLRKWDQ